MKSNVLDQRQEIKEEILLSLVDKCFDQIDFSGSIEKAYTLKHHLFERYKLKFVLKQVAKCYKTVAKQRKLAQEREARVRRE